MGQKQSMSEPAPKTGQVEQFDCHVSTGGCSGINFRPNPYTGSKGSGMRQVDNGDFLEGIIYEKDGKDYLKVSKIKRGGKSGSDWEAVNGEQWMPGDGGSFNGGRWLHPIK